MLGRAAARRRSRRVPSEGRAAAEGLTLAPYPTLTDG